MGLDGDISLPSIGSADADAFCPIPGPSRRRGKSHRQRFQAAAKNPGHPGSASPGSGRWCDDMAPARSAD